LLLLAIVVTAVAFWPSRHLAEVKKLQEELRNPELTREERGEKWTQLKQAEKKLSFKERRTQYQEMLKPTMEKAKAYMQMSDEEKNQTLLDREAKMNQWRERMGRGGRNGGNGGDNGQAGAGGAGRTRGGQRGDGQQANANGQPGAPNAGGAPG